MATRKMTFTLPEDLAARFARRVPARERSRYLAEALAQRLAERDRQLIRACEIANGDPEVRVIENEFESLPRGNRGAMERGRASAPSAAKSGG